MTFYSKEHFEKWKPEKPTVLTQTKNFIELSFHQSNELFDSLNDGLLYKLQTKSKILGWVNVYCGGKSSKIIDNLQPGRPHKFRLKIILKSSKLQDLNKVELDKIKMATLEKGSTENNNFVIATNELNVNFNEDNVDFQDFENESLEINENSYKTDEKVKLINDQFIKKKLVGAGQNHIRSNNNIISETINPYVNSGAVLNNAKSNELIESQWSDELTACTDTEGPTVFCFCMAVRCGYTKQVQAMLEERPNLIGICNTTDGFTPLATAVRKGNTQMVKYLLGEGADVNQRSATGQTPLHLAVYSANVPLTELLLERGADIECRDRNGLTLLHYAVDSGDLPMLTYALEIADVGGRDNKGWTALHRAVMQGASAAIVQELLGRGADGEARDRRGLSCARLAALPRGRDDLRRLVDRTFARDTAVTNFTKLAKKLTTIHTIAHK